MPAGNGGPAGIQTGGSQWPATVKCWPEEKGSGEVSMATHGASQVATRNRRFVLSPALWARARTTAPALRAVAEPGLLPGSAWMSSTGQGSSGPTSRWRCVSPALPCRGRCRPPCESFATENGAQTDSLVEEPLSTWLPHVREVLLGTSILDRAASLGLSDRTSRSRSGKCESANPWAAGGAWWPVS